MGIFRWGMFGRFSCNYDPLKEVVDEYLKIHPFIMPSDVQNWDAYELPKGVMAPFLKKLAKSGTLSSTTVYKKRSPGDKPSRASDTLYYRPEKEEKLGHALTQRLTPEEAW